MEVAASIAHESRPELGPGSLAEQQGYRNPAQLIAATTGTTAGDAVRLVKVGEATAPRANLIGEALPAKLPAVREALSTGRIGAAAASMLVTFLDRMIVNAGRERAAEAERVLVDLVPGLPGDEVRRAITRMEAYLDPDGVAPWEDELRGRASVSMFERGERLALVERDGGCAFCGLPPGMTKAHLVARWARDHGPPT